MLTFNPKSLRDIHRIREEHFKETRDLTPQEFTERLHKNCDEYIQRNGWSKIPLRKDIFCLVKR